MPGERKRRSYADGANGGIAKGAAAEVVHPRLRYADGDRGLATMCMPGFDEEDPTGGPTEATSNTPDKIVVRRGVTVSYGLTEK